MTEFIFQLNDLDIEPIDVKRTLSFEDRSSSKLDDIVERGPMKDGDVDDVVDAERVDHGDKFVTEEQLEAKSNYLFIWGSA